MIHPLTGQCLVEMLPAGDRTGSGLSIPDQAKDKATIGIVRIMGHWPASKNGLHRLPEFRVGDKVVIGKYTGIQMHRGIGDKYKMIKQDQVLAVLS